MDFIAFETQRNHNLRRQTETYEELRSQRKFAEERETFFFVKTIAELANKIKGNRQRKKKGERILLLRKYIASGGFFQIPFNFPGRVSNASPNVHQLHDISEKERERERERGGGEENTIKFLTHSDEML